MTEKQDIFWQKFLETGEVRDYLQYRKKRGMEEEKPCHRIRNITRKREWY